MEKGIGKVFTGFVSPLEGVLGRRRAPHRLRLPAKVHPADTRLPRTKRALSAPAFVGGA